MIISNNKFSQFQGVVYIFDAFNKQMALFKIAYDTETYVYLNILLAETNSLLLLTFTKLTFLWRRESSFWKLFWFILMIIIVMFYYVYLNSFKNEAETGLGQTHLPLKLNNFDWNKQKPYE